MGKIADHTMTDDQKKERYQQLERIHQQCGTINVADLKQKIRDFGMETSNSYMWRTIRDLDVVFTTSLPEDIDKCATILHDGSNPKYSRLKFKRCDDSKSREYAVEWRGNVNVDSIGR